MNAFLAVNARRKCQANVRARIFCSKSSCNFHARGNFARERKDIEEEMGVKRNFSPKDSVLPSGPLPRASFLSGSAFGFAFTRTTPRHRPAVVVVAVAVVSRD